MKTFAPSSTLIHQIQDEWERTFDALQDVVTILSPDLVVVRANKAAYTTFGIGNGQLIGRQCFEVFHGKSEPCERCPAWQPHPQASSEKGLVYNHRLDKTFEVTSSPVFDDNGVLKYLVHSARDITQKLKDEEERNILSAAVEQTTESVVITDKDGGIQYINPSYAEITGYSREELIGKSIGFLNIDKESALLFEEIFNILKTGSTWQGRLTSRKKDGSHFEENATISPITQKDGEISHFVAVKRDVSKEEQLQRQLQQAMKMEAIGTLAGGIAHDFNNILSAMIGYGQIAKGRLDKNDPLRSDIEQILLAGDRAANLVKQILTFSRRDTQENFHPLKVQYIIKEVIRLLRSSFPATIELRQRIDDNCSPILADPSQLHQVIMNLCTNAKQAIGGDYGSLLISLREITVAEPRLLFGASLLTSGNYAHLMVEDNGPGMTEEIQKRIFDPFFTTKPKDQGTGLGLSVAFGIVEKHGGVITVDSTVGIGTAFHVYFPVIRQDIPSHQDTVEPDCLGTECIMVVDDEVVLARIMERLLSKLGYTVKLYTNSLEAVHHYRKNPYDVDLIITDMTMPNMTGAELAREVLSLRPELPIIMTTGYSEVIDEEKASSIGIAEFMLKPVKKIPLMQMVRKVLDNAKNSRS
jgi:PAS domain S-box-containing protein